MTTDRRTFLKLTAIAGGTAAVSSLPGASALMNATTNAVKPLRILILGGTVFLGRHIVEAAVARGHELTLFNRGQRNPELFPQIEKLRGNRDGDFFSLRWSEYHAGRKIATRVLVGRRRPRRRDRHSPATGAGVFCALGPVQVHP